jgi:AraC-like DNA-binding protein
MNDACSTDFAPQAWTTSALPAHRQFEAWREVIVDAHLSWDIPKIDCEQFPAGMRQHRFEGVRLTDCTAPTRVSGTRGRAHIARDDEAYLTVVMVAEGSETLRFGDVEVHLTAGMFTLWDSTRPMAFATGEQLRQMSLLVPESELLRRMPRVRDLVGRPMGDAGGAGGLFVDHFQALMQRFGELSPAVREPVLDATLDLLGVCLGEQASLPAPRVRRLMLEQVQRHIDKHLTDPALGVASLARAFRMSERNLHKLFEGSGSTLSAYIRDQRLAMCRRDLGSRALMSRQIAEIARHWGFTDPGHFSKAFRTAYGMSPSELRARAAASVQQ